MFLYNYVKKKNPQYLEIFINEGSIVWRRWWWGQFHESLGKKLCLNGVQLRLTTFYWGKNEGNLKQLRLMYKKKKKWITNIFETLAFFFPLSPFNKDTSWKGKDIIKHSLLKWFLWALNWMYYKYFVILSVCIIVNNYFIRLIMVPNNISFKCKQDFLHEPSQRMNFP